jgi:Fe-S-cluster containining protein
MLFTLVNWLQGGRSERKVRQTGCLACGKCCELFGGHLRATTADLDRWRRLGENHLLDRVNRLGWIWVDPQTRRPVPTCPFLEATGPETKTCTIHAHKPDMCRDYPTLAHGHRCLRGVHFPGLRAGIVWGPSSKPWRAASWFN